jgi:hypothetical protein
MQLVHTCVNVSYISRCLICFGGKLLFNVLSWIRFRMDPYSIFILKARSGTAFTYNAGYKSRSAYKRCGSKTLNTTFQHMKK